MPITYNLRSDPISNTNNFRYPGQYDDEITALYYNHHRYYVPDTGRYNQVDCYVCSSNPYYYAGNNPITFLDPEGLDCKYIGTVYIRITYYTNAGISGITKSGYPAGPDTVAVDLSQYKLKWQNKKKLKEQDCKWNEFYIPYAGARVALDTGGSVKDRIDVWFKTDKEGKAFLRKINPNLKPNGEYANVMVYECSE